MSDGSRTYTQPNRLVAISGPGLEWSAMYNGDGARLQQTVNGSVTTYTLDLAAPLVTVLAQQNANGTQHYLYARGTRPLAQDEAGAWTYLLPDGLGSVRHLTGESGAVTLAKSYRPYGDLLESQGGGTSVFGFTGEEADETGLVFLRARYMQPTLGIFLSRDPWPGDLLRPGSMNGWSYVEGNPINQVDPSGLHTEKDIEWMFKAKISDRKWHFRDWYKGSSAEIEHRFNEIYEGLEKFAVALGSLQSWDSAMQLPGRQLTLYYNPGGTSGARATPEHITFRSTSLSHPDSESMVIHEIAHVWAFQTVQDGQDLNEHYRQYLGAVYVSRIDGGIFCSHQFDKSGQRTTVYDPGLCDRGKFFDPQHQDIGPDSPLIDQGLSNHIEDLAVSVTTAIDGRMPRNSYRLYWIAAHMPGVKRQYGISDYELAEWRMDMMPGWLRRPCSQ